MTTEETPARPGSGADLSRRMDRIEQRQDGIEAEVRTLADSVSRVALNQTHQSELNKLRFDSLDASINNVGATLERFMARINSIITGEIQLPQSVSLMTDWRDWREEVDKDRDGQAVLNGQVRLLGRLAVLLVTSQLAAIIVALYALIK
jgi:hypothetical protein